MDAATPANPAHIAHVNGVVTDYVDAVRAMRAKGRTKAAIIETLTLAEPLSVIRTADIYSALTARMVGVGSRPALDAETLADALYMKVVALENQAAPAHPASLVPGLKLIHNR